jgi:glycosyltransferase involved in cell wall biosynthesis
MQALDAIHSRPEDAPVEGISLCDNCFHKEIHSDEVAPPISIVLPVYNAERFLAETIGSIINQSITYFELIIVDDCSSDGSWDLILHHQKNDSRIRAFRNKLNIGGCATLNKALALVRGKYIARHDHDDWSYPTRLEKQFNFLESNPEVGILGAAIELIDQSGIYLGRREYKLTDMKIRSTIFFYSPFAHPVVMIRKTVLEKVGYYNPEYAPADDYELYFRIGNEAKFANLPEVLLRYRILSSSITSINTKRMEVATINVRKKFASFGNYKFSLVARAYNYLHYISIYIIPAKLKIRLFNLLRNS